MADAASEFFGQANSFDQSVGGFVGSAVVDLVKADVMGRQANVGLIESLLVGPDGKPRPNIEVTDTLVFDSGKDQSVEFDISEPLFVATELSSFLPTAATIDMSMNIDAQASDQSSYKAQESGSGTGSVGWGPFKASVHISATAAESGSSTRKSDYRSKAAVHVEMGRVAAPEGVSRLNDLLTDLGDIAKQFAKAKARDAAQQAAQASGLVPGGSGGGGGGGSGS